MNNNINRAIFALSYITAIALAAMGAYEAVPFASASFGTPVVGWGISASVALAIFAGWHFFHLVTIDPKSYRELAKRKGQILSVTLLFVLINSLSIFAGASIELEQARIDREHDKAMSEYIAALAGHNARKSSYDAEYADYQKKLSEYNSAIQQERDSYAMAEKARMQNVAQLRAEIKATKKAKQPGMYSDLLSRLAVESVPLQFAPVAKEPAKPEYHHSEKPAEPIKSSVEFSVAIYNSNIGLFLQSFIFDGIIPFVLLFGALSSGSNVPERESGTEKSKSGTETEKKTKVVRNHWWYDDQNVKRNALLSELSCDEESLNLVGDFIMGKVELNNQGMLSLRVIRSHIKCGNAKATQIKDALIKHGVFVECLGNNGRTAGFTYASVGCGNFVEK